MVSGVRLFIALPVPDSFAAAAAALPRKGIEARWTHRDDLHMTIRFLGDTDPARVPEIEERLARVRRPPLHIEVRGMGAFDNKSQSVLYARVESVRKLAALCGDITDLMTPLGFDFGMRDYVPHITLARLGQRAGLDDYIKRHGSTMTARWEAGEFCLMQSAPPNENSRHYNVLSTYKLVY